MFNKLLIEEVFNQPWYIETQYLQGLVMSVWGTLKNPGTKSENLSNYEMPYAISHGDNKRHNSNYQPGSVGIITLDGPVVENSDPGYGVKGTLELCDEFQAMEEDPNIIGTVFKLNTGGGAAYAMKPLEDMLSSLSKPNVIHSRKVIASAGYGLGAHGDYIMMYHPQGIVGSIGTMCTLTNIQSMFEKWGVQFHEIYATLSELKNKSYNDALKGNYDSLREKMLDPMNNTFIKSVKSLRGDKIDPNEKGIYQGETYMAKKAVKLGLIDGLGSEADAVNKVREISSGKSNSANKKNQPDMKFPKVFSLAGIVKPTQAQLDEANAEMGEAGITSVVLVPEALVTDAAQVTKDLTTSRAEVTRLTGELATANTNLGAVQTSLATTQTENTELKAKIAKGPAAVAPVVDPKEVKTELTDAEKYQQEIDELPHNKALIGNPLFN